MITSIIEVCPICLHILGEVFILSLIAGRYVRHHKECSHEQKDTTIE